jgi:hypothetical protein
MPTRRQFLGGSVLAGAGALTAGLVAPRRAHAFGEVPKAADGLLPPAASSVLEIFLFGGMSTWESFYAVEAYGRADDPTPALRNTQLYTFLSDERPFLKDVLGTCGSSSNLTDLVKPFAKDAAGVAVGLGPFAAPLWDDPLLLDRLRVVVSRHGLEPHEAAVPLAITGKTLGSPAGAALGAHLQRALAPRFPTRRTPQSYVLSTTSFPTDNIRACVATGLHPGTARPLSVRLDYVSALTTQLARPGAGLADERATRDALLATYEAQMQARLTRGGFAVRSRHFADQTATTLAVTDADAVSGLLDPALLQKVDATVCGTTTGNTPGMMLGLASHLLSHPTDPAAYVCVVDPGLVGADGGGGYDSHIENSLTQARNVRNILGSLAAQIRRPGESADGKIDLDKTLVVLNMEFGRSPTAQGGAGRNHWPYGYTQIYLGGPAAADGQSKGIYGAIDPTGQATVYATPAENRIACLLAMGVWPFGPEGFGVSDVQGAVDEVDAATRVLRTVLGRNV